MSVPQNAYRQEFKVTIESAANVDYDGKGDSAHAIVPNAPPPYFIATNETRRTIGDKIQADTQTAFAQNIIEEALKNGIVVYQVSMPSLQYRWIERNRYTSYIFPATPITIYSETYSLDMTVSVLSDKPFSQSPMPLWVMKIIQWTLQAVVLALIAYWAIQAINACIQSLYVKKQTVTTFNPDGTIRETTTTEEPTLNAVWIIIGAIIVIGLLVFMSQGGLKGFKGKGFKGKK